MNLIDNALHEYATHFSSQEPIFLQELYRETHLKVLMPHMISGYQQGLFLQLLVKLTGAKSILEIGTFTGYSGICMALGLPPNGELHTVEVNEELEEIIQRYVRKAQVENLFHLHIGNAIEIIPTFAQTFDMVFIDADKKNYATYYDLVFPKVKIGGLIIADNVLWSGKVALPIAQHDKETANIHAFNQKILNDSRVQNMLLPLRDGLMIALKIKSC